MRGGAGRAAGSGGRMPEQQASARGWTEREDEAPLAVDTSGGGRVPASSDGRGRLGVWERGYQGLASRTACAAREAISSTRTKRNVECHKGQSWWYLS